MKNCSFINFLPPWVETNIQPAFYDKESGTVLQQTARMYAKVNQLVRCFNALSKEVQDYIKQVIDLRDYVEDYFENLDVQEEINNKLDAMVESGEFQELVGEYISYKVDYYEITDQSESKVQEILSNPRSSIIVFKNDYTFTSTKRIAGNKIIDLNGNTITFDIPNVTEDVALCHGFFNFKDDDVFTVYNGNGNITFKNGVIAGGNLSFCHAQNITVENIYFEKCKNNHVLEMCAIDGLKVEGCTFEGIPYGSSGEYIQNDSATHGAFPWFDEESTTYDGTVCRNFTINNCNFIRSNDQNYIFSGGVGTHSGSELDAGTTYNMTITNCRFVGAKEYSVQFYNAKNLVVRNCYFETDTDTESFTHIRLRAGIRDSVIQDNKFVAGTRCIQTSAPWVTTYNLTIENNVFTNYNSALYSDYGIITIGDPYNCKILDNIFEDFSQYCIILNKTNSYDDNNEYITYVENNLIRPKHIIQGAVNINCGVGYVSGNTFDCTGYTPASDLVYARNTAKGLYASSNLFSDNVTKDVNDSTKMKFSEVYDIIKRYWSGSQTSVTINPPSDNMDVTKFNRIGLTIGSTSNVQSITISPYTKTGKIQAQTWSFPVIGSDGTISKATLQLNESSQLIYSGAVALKLLYVYNEM